MRAKWLTIGFGLLWAWPGLGGWVLDGQLLAPDAQINAIDLPARTWANDASGRVTTLAAVVLTNAGAFDAAGAASAATGTLAQALRAEQSAGTQGVLAAISGRGYLTNNSYAATLIMGYTYTTNIVAGDTGTNTLIVTEAGDTAVNGTYTNGFNAKFYQVGGPCWFSIPPSSPNWHHGGAIPYYCMASEGDPIPTFNWQVGDGPGPTPTVSYATPTPATTNILVTTNLTISGSSWIILPTSTNGLASGVLWNSNGIPRIVP